MSFPVNPAMGAGARSKTTASHKQHQNTSATHSARPDHRSQNNIFQTYSTGKLNVSVHFDSIVESSASAIVSSESIYLKSKSPLAASIAKCAGGQYRTKLTELSRKHPKNDAGTIFWLPASSDKPWKVVIIVVAPMWSRTGAPGWPKCMKTIIRDVVNTVSDLRLRSVAFPLIGTGKRNAPLDVVVKTFCDTLKSIKNTNLKEVELFTTDRKSFTALSDYCDASLRVVYGETKGSQRKEDQTAADVFKSANNIDPLESGGVDSDSSDESDAAESLPNVNRISIREDAADDNCAICMDQIHKSQRKVLPCKHVFCEDCVEEWFKRARFACPTCNKPCGIITGNQPPGEMSIEFRDDVVLPGYERHGSIIVEYYINEGVQGDNHSNPGVPFSSCSRLTYFPDTAEGREVVELLRIAFDRKLIFTVGTSTTTGRENVVTWNDIHHKTRIHGGSEHYGYPDPQYLSRVKEELASKGITSDSLRK